MEDSKLVSLSDEEQTQVTGGSPLDSQSCPVCSGKGYIVIVGDGVYKRKPCTFCSGGGSVTAIRHNSEEEYFF